MNLRCGAGEKQRNNFNLSPPQQLFADYSTNLAKEPLNEPAIFTGRERNRHPYLPRLRSSTEIFQHTAASVWQPVFNVKAYLRGWFDNGAAN